MGAVNSDLQLCLQPSPGAGSGRTSRAVLKAHVDAQARASSRVSANRPWTPREDAVLYERMISPVALAVLLGRTARAVSQRRSVLGISARNGSDTGCGTGPKTSAWTAAEDLVIRRTDISTRQMAVLLGRTHAAVRIRRSHLKITFTGCGNTRSQHEPRPDGIPAPVAQLLGTQQLQLAV